MGWHRTSTVGQVPDDPVGEAAAAAVVEILGGATVELAYAPDDGPAFDDTGVASGTVAHGTGPRGWRRRVEVRFDGRIAPIVPAEGAMGQLVRVLPAAVVATAERFDGIGGGGAVEPAVRRALRDTLAIEILGHLHAAKGEPVASPALIGEVVEFLIELSGTRVESHDLTHGVVVTDALDDTPRLTFRYPADLRAAKRAPLLFDGQRSVLVVDGDGRARTELQRHRLDRLATDKRTARTDAFVDSGAFVAEATRRLGGIGFYLRSDRTVWAFLDGRPVVVRRGEHWTAFPIELTGAIDHVIGGGAAAAIVVQTALLLSAQRLGAILAIVDDAERLDGIVSDKDRFDLRDAADPDAMRMETRLHHLIDAEHIDEHTLARLAALDGATVVDRDGSLLAYGAIVASAGSQYEGARTAAAKTLSETATVVLKVSTDGDITVFRDGEPIATLLGQSPRSA